MAMSLTHAPWARADRSVTSRQSPVGRGGAARLGRQGQPGGVVPPGREGVGAGGQVGGGAAAEVLLGRLRADPDGAVVVAVAAAALFPVPTHGNPRCTTPEAFP